MGNHYERRFEASEIRAEVAEGGKKVLTGYAAKFNTLSSDLGGFKETLKPKAFNRALSENHDTKFLINHNPSSIVGRSGHNLTLKADGIGLQYRVELPNTQAANDLHENVKSGLMSSMSFGFIPTDTTWRDTTDSDGKPLALREINDLTLKDVSAVTFPAYKDTSIQARSLVELRSLFPEGIDDDVAAHMDKPLVEELRGKVVPSKDWETRGSKSADVSALLGKISDAYKLYQAESKNVAGAVDSKNSDKYDKGNGKLAVEVKALIALFTALDKSVDSENYESSLKADANRSQKLHSLQIAAAINGS
jgi:HK97 family phage prohead protease